MKLLHTLGTLFQALSVLIFLGGVMGALVIPRQQDAYARASAYLGDAPYVAVNTAQLAFTIGAAATLSALFLLAFGTICKAQAITAENSERTAAALEALAARRRQQ